MKILVKLFGIVLNAFYNIWCASLHITEVNRAALERYDIDRKNLIFALWHDELFLFPFVRKQLRILTVVSKSRDGEYLAQLLESLGLLTARGSSSRGGLGVLLRAAKLMKKQGYHACITIDGPRGPRHVPKDGVVFLAHHTPAHIVPMRAFCSRAKVFASWDKFQLPLPFSRVELVYGEPYAVNSDKLTAGLMELERNILQQKLDLLAPGGK